MAEHAHVNAFFGNGLPLQKLNDFSFYYLFRVITAPGNCFLATAFA